MCSLSYPSGFEGLKLSMQDSAIIAVTRKNVVQRKNTKKKIGTKSPVVALRRGRANKRGCSGPCKSVCLKEIHLEV